jgi:phosphoribosylformimino-5-aminoimidazole carboxamide ribotide isomerase
MIELIPSIDIIGGKCVRLTQGRFDRRKVYSGRPEEIALRFEGMGLRRLHLVDLDGARAGHVVNLHVLEDIAGRTSLRIDFGGGIKSDEDIRRVFDSGAEMVTAGSISVREPERVKEWLKTYGQDRLILGADARNGKIAVQGWQEETSLDLLEFVRSWAGAGIGKVICTEIAVDGTLQGPALALYRELAGSFPGLEIIASGGVAGIQDVRDLEATGVRGVIFGRAYYEGKITDNEIKTYLGTD